MQVNTTVFVSLVNVLLPVCFSLAILALHSCSLLLSSSGLSSMIPIKTNRQIEKMRASCRVTRGALETLSAAVEPGVTTGEIDRLAGELIEETGGKSAFKGYRGFPGNVCVSVNEEVVHGIGGSRRVAYGDLVKIDMGIILDGWYGDTATTIAVGAVDARQRDLLDVTMEALDAGIGQARAGNRVGDIGAAIEKLVRASGFGVVREFVGHGLGRKLHEEPQVPNYGKPRTGAKLKPGMVLAIEPMVTVGRADIRVLDDGWTVITADRSRSAHFEHTVLITGGAAEILTASPAMAESRREG